MSLANDPWNDRDVYDGTEWDAAGERIEREEAYRAAYLFDRSSVAGRAVASILEFSLARGHEPAGVINREDAVRIGAGPLCVVCGEAKSNWRHVPSVVFDNRPAHEFVSAVTKGAA
jgi:hypothetical protein